MSKQLNRDVIISAVVAIALHVTAAITLGDRLIIQPRLEDDGVIALNVVLAEMTVQPQRFEQTKEAAIEPAETVDTSIRTNRANPLFDARADQIDETVLPLRDTTAVVHATSLLHPPDAAEPEDVNETAPQGVLHTPIQPPIESPQTDPVRLPREQARQTVTHRADPHAQRNPPPEYPPVARRRGWEGVVQLRIEVLTNGRVGRIELETSSRYSVFNEAAMTAVRTWRFTPALRDGLPVNRWITVPIEFHLDDSPNTQ